jgi:2,3-bisphosphoglycerate-dependent phosphoglycerate mutase
MRDAGLVADILGERPITTVLSSPYTRARQTVEPLANRLGLRICTDERFRERGLGQWSDSSFGEAVHRTWVDMDFAFPGGETNRQAQARAIQGLQELIEGDIPGHILISTHGNLLALMLVHYDPQVDYEFWRALSMPDIYQLEVGTGCEARYLRLWEGS